MSATMSGPETLRTMSTLTVRDLPLLARSPPPASLVLNSVQKVSTRLVLVSQLSSAYAIVWETEEKTLSS